MVTMPISDIDKKRIAEAVAKAEAGSSGEIVCALTGEVSSYRETPLAWAAAAALVLPPLALALGVGFLPMVIGGFAWTAAQASAVEGEIALALSVYAAVQLALFVVAFLIASIPAVRRAITPRTLKRHKVERAAHHQFAALAARAHTSETGVLIFVAPIDRQVQILADAAIHQKCGETPWERAAQAIAAAMKHGEDPTSGIIEAVQICGAALSEHFPAAGPRPAGFSTEPMEV
jgi:putative membrane protein